MFVPMNTLRKAYTQHEGGTSLHQQSAPKYKTRMESGLYHPRRAEMKKSFHGLVNSYRKSLMGR